MRIHSGFLSQISVVIVISGNQFQFSSMASGQIFWPKSYNMTLDAADPNNNC